MIKGLVGLAAMVLLVAGCSSSATGKSGASPSAVAQNSAEPEASASASSPRQHSPVPTPTTGTVVATPTIIVETPTPSPVSGSTERQWASGATATSNYGANAGDAWNATQATGAPNATCADDEHAWASLQSNTIETLTLSYTDAVAPSMVRIVQSYNPGHVSKVVVSGGGQSAEVYSDAKAADAPGGQPCVTLEVPISGVKFNVSTVAVTVDQTKVDSWCEIDAVELVGTKP